MVNAGFPSAQSYGFEMVHVRFAGGETAEPAINRKFTANPFGGIFRKFFAS